MGKTEINAHGQKPKISKLAIASVSLGVLGSFILALPAVIIKPRLWPGVLVPNFVGLVGIFGLIFGVVAFVRIKKSKAMLKGGAFAISGIILTALISGMWLLDLMGRPRCTAYRMLCGSNLARLGRAMLIYANDNGQYPEPNQWCDSLLEHGEVGVEHFVCPSIVVYWPFKNGKMLTWRPVPKKGRSHYAMNPNCEPNSPPDTVLLFEAKGGWNQFGGPKLLSTERHEGDGCNVLHNDAQVLFEPAMAELNWAGEQKQ